VVVSLLLDLQPTVAGRLTTVDFKTLRFSGFSFLSARNEGHGFRFIARSEVTPDDLTIELRGVPEAPTPAFATSLRLDADQVEGIRARLTPATRVVLCCRSGLRAWRAASRLRTAGHDNVALLALGD
jgi:rhodanese-related sulfurtransferase